MIKSGLIVKNRFLSGGAYPSDYDPQGRTGSYSVTRPGDRDHFDTGFETAAKVSPYQETVEEYSAVTPRSVYKPKKLRTKNLAKFGPTAYNSMFSKKNDELSDYVAQRLIGLVDTDSRMSQSMQQTNNFEGYREPPPGIPSTANSTRSFGPTGSVPTNRTASMPPPSYRSENLPDYSSPANSEEWNRLFDRITFDNIPNMGPARSAPQSTSTPSDFRSPVTLSPENVSSGAGGLDVIAELTLANQQAPIYDFAIDDPDNQLSANALVESNPSDVMNALGDTVEQQTTIGPVRVTRPRRGFGLHGSDTSSTSRR